MTAANDDIQEHDAPDDKNGAATSDKTEFDGSTGQNESEAAPNSSNQSLHLPATSPTDNPQSADPTPPTAVCIM